MNERASIAIDDPALKAAGVRTLIDINPVVGERREGARRFWTGREIKILKAHYPDEGELGCVVRLPGRSAHAIYAKASQCGLTRPGAGGGKRERHKWTWSAAQDEAIRRVYAGKPSGGAVKQLARTLGRPMHAISRRALLLGLSLPRFKELPWSEAEIALLRALGGSGNPLAIARVFRAKGFSRTPAAIKVRLRRLHIHKDADDGHFTAAGLGVALGMDRKRVSVLIQRGLLKAKRHRVSEGPLGDAPWRIAARDARAFIVDNVAIIDFARVDKFWLVDLLAGPQRASRKDEARGHE